MVLYHYTICVGFLLHRLMNFVSYLRVLLLGYFFIYSGISSNCTYFDVSTQPVLGSYDLRILLESLLTAYVIIHWHTVF